MNAFPQDWLYAAATVPNLILALTFQINFFPIFKGMKNVTDRKMSQACITGIIFCVVAYLIIGIMGYYYVGN